MALGLGWKLHGDGHKMGPDDVVAPDERLSWGKTVGLGAQHVVAMFGATFVFPLIMGLNPQLAIMMSGIATIAFLLIVQGKVPSYLGTSAAFVGGVAAIRAQGGDSPEVTGAIDSRSRTSSFASASESLIPFSITYSNVIRRAVVSPG